MEKLQLPNDLTNDIVNSIPVGIMVLDSKDCVGWVNDSLLHMTGASVETMLGTNQDSIEREDLRILFSSHRNIVIRDGDHNERLLIKSELSPEHATSEGQRVIYFQDLTESLLLDQERYSQQHEITDLSLKHPVTGLLTHRAMMLVLEPQVSRSRRYSNPLSIALLHLDIDDRNHSPSEALRLTGRLLKDQLRWADMIGHDQQGNFMMILPETTGEAASSLAEKISQQVHDIPGINHSHVGITEWRKGDSTSSLMKRVGSALVDACETDSPATLSA